LLATGFNALSPQDQQKAARLIWKEYVAHFKKEHGKDSTTYFHIALHDGKDVRIVDDGKVEPKSGSK
jgi:hypothetical protein